MELKDFINHYQESITQNIVKNYPPLYQRNGHNRQNLDWTTLTRQPLGEQKNAVQGVVLALEKYQRSNVVGEMGTGKTYIAIAAAALNQTPRSLIICPPHLTDKWKREVEITVPKAQTVIINRIEDVNRLKKQQQPNRPLFVVLSNTMASLGYYWRNSAMWENRTESWKCPNCFYPVVNKDGIAVSDTELNKKKMICRNTDCGQPLWSADNKGNRRYPLAKYIKKRLKNFFDLLIVDEVHQFKQKNSARGTCAGILAEAIPQSITLTGTYMGGYSSSIFYMLRRFNRKIIENYGWNEETEWVKDYGFYQYITHGNDSELSNGRASSRKTSTKKTTKETPGLSPKALLYILPNTVFIKLEDLQIKLPEYQEVVTSCQLQGTPQPNDDLSQAAAYHTLERALKTVISKMYDRRASMMLSTYLQSTLAYPENCWKGETIYDPIDGELIVNLPPLNEVEMYPKEQKLIDIIKEEKQNNRKVLVLATHTQHRDITQRLENLIRTNRLHVMTLRDNNAKTRESRIQKALEKNPIDVLISHPGKIELGLDLLDFPTIIWYETSYSVYSMRQASRRSWRIGQTKPVKVIFMTYNQTIQNEALRLSAAKVQASLAVEGELPEDGLSSYSENENIFMSLAKNMMQNMNEENDNLVADSDEWDIQQVINQSLATENQYQGFFIDEFEQTEDDYAIEKIIQPVIIAPPVRTPEPETVPMDKFLAVNKKGERTQQMTFFHLLEEEREPQPCG